MRRFVTDFTLPELGENIAAGDVLRVLVKPGDTLAKDQPVLELETDKATIEVPSSVAGQVKDVKVKAGDKVKVGQAILSVDDGAARRRRQPRRRRPRRSRAAAAAPKRGSAGRRPQQPHAATPPAPRRRSRRGGRATARRPRRRQGRRHQPRRAAGRRSRRAPELPVGAGGAVGAPHGARARRRHQRGAGQRADGRISVDDVKAHAKRLVDERRRPRRRVGRLVEPLPDFSRWGDDRASADARACAARPPST